MLTCFFSDDGAKKTATPIILLTETQYKNWLPKQTEEIKHWLSKTGFTWRPSEFTWLPGERAQVLYCINDMDQMWETGGLALTLPEGNYYFSEEDIAGKNALSWGLGAYQFTRYKKPSRAPAKLFLRKDIAKEISQLVSATYMVRDLINTPAEDMGPTQLEMAAKELAQKYQARFSSIVGEELLAQEFRCIDAVGRACDDAPRLLDLRWGDESHPKVTLVGKGVCFDTGGLDLKSSFYMQLMKKDMGGAAHVLGLAQLIMQSQMPVRLRVLIPAVENSVSGNAFRPGDVIKSKQGLTIEVGNTDAEGRLILADALTEASLENPDLLIDMATLTGAARVALGTDVAVMFSSQDALAEEVKLHANRVQDPVWQLPLYAPYRELINSPIADLNNNATEPFGGAITAALFLQAFVPASISWLHFDVMGWNTRARPGRPSGGEAFMLRGLFAFLKARYH